MPQMSFALFPLHTSYVPEQQGIEQTKHRDGRIISVQQWKSWRSAFTSLCKKETFSVEKPQPS